MFKEIMKGIAVFTASCGATWLIFTVFIPALIFPSDVSATKFKLPIVEKYEGSQRQKNDQEYINIRNYDRLVVLLRLEKLEEQQHEHFHQHEDYKVYEAKHWHPKTDIKSYKRYRKIKDTEAKAKKKK